MNRTEFLEFVSKNFNIGGDAMRLIDNILQYAERIVDLAERREFLNDTLMGHDWPHRRGNRKNYTVMEEPAMTVHELTREQLIELKQHMLCEQGSPSYGELADADELVSDEAAFAELTRPIFQKMTSSVRPGNERKGVFYEQKTPYSGYHDTVWVSHWNT